MRINRFLSRTVCLNFRAFLIAVWKRNVKIVEYILDERFDEKDKESFGFYEQDMKIWNIIPKVFSFFVQQVPLCSPSQILSLDESDTPESQETDEELLQILTDIGVESITNPSPVGLEPDFISFVTIANQLKTDNTISPPPCSTHARLKRATRTDTGLRFLANKILEKVKEKKETSFDEIANEILSEQASNQNDEAINKNPKGAEKNTKRRVYDVLNVLVAMEMISKDRKQITWVGLPSEVPDEQHRLEKEKKEIEDSIQQKTADLQQSILNQIAYKNLIQKKSIPQQASPAAASSTVHLPFIAVRTSKNTVITHTTSKDELEHVFNFDQPFQIHDNMEVLMRMGMAFGLERNMCSEKNLEISRTMVSKELVPYLEGMAITGPHTLNKSP